MYVYERWFLEVGFIPKLLKDIRTPDFISLVTFSSINILKPAPEFPLLSKALKETEGSFFLRLHNFDQISFPPKFA